MRLLPLALLLACQGPVRLWPPAECEAGRIVVASKMEAFTTLADALAAAEADDEVCLGEGAFALSGGVGRVEVGGGEAGRLHVEGQGADVTTIVGGDAATDLSLWFGEGSEIGIAGVTFEDARFRAEADAVVLRDVVVRGLTSQSERAFEVVAGGYVLDDVTLAESRLDYGAGFRLDGDGEIADLSVRDVVFEEGYLGEISGTAAWSGGEVTGNERILDADGYDLVEFWGALDVEGVQFVGNRTNGPLLSGIGALTARDLVVDGNDATGSTVVRLYDYDGWQTSLSLSDSVVTGNVGADGALGAYDGATLSVERVDFAGNAPCDVVVDGVCAATDLGEDATFTCDEGGCG